MTNIETDKFKLTKDELYILTDPSYIIPNYMWDSLIESFKESNNKGNTKIITLDKESKIFLGKVKNPGLYFVSIKSGIELKTEDWIELEDYICCISVDDIIELGLTIPENSCVFKSLENTIISYKKFILDGNIFLDTTI